MEFLARKSVISIAVCQEILIQMNDVFQLFKGSEQAKKLFKRYQTMQAAQISLQQQQLL